MKTYTIQVTYTATKEVQVTADSLRDAQLEATSIISDMNKNKLCFKFESADQIAAAIDLPEDLDPMIEEVINLMTDLQKDCVETHGIYQRKTRTLYDGEEVVNEVLVDYIYIEDGELTVTYSADMLDQDNCPDDEPLYELDYHVQYDILKQALESLAD